MLDSIYGGIGFQLHYKRQQHFHKAWCASCKSDWNIIVVNVSKYLDKKFYNNRQDCAEIQYIYSCVIVDT